VTANTLEIGTVSDATGGGAVGMMFFGGGSLYVSNHVTLGARTGTVGSSRGALHLLGGTAEVAGDILDGSSVSTCLSTVVVDGVTLDLQPAGDAVAGVIGSATEPINVLQLLSGTLRDVAEINGGGTVVKDGPGTLVLDGATAYTGPTVVSNGTLRVNCSLGASGVTVEAGGTLGGDGSLGGSAVINPGGTLAPGASIGDLEVMDTLTLLGHTVMESAKAGGVVSNDRVYNLFTVDFGGTLTVTASGQPLAAGDSLALFSAAFYNGWFAGIALPTLPDDLAWDTNKLRTTGILDVYSFSFSTQHLAAVKNTAATLPVATLLAKASSTRGGPLVLALVSATSAMGGSVSNDGANIFYTPASNYVGPDMFTCTISDGQGEIAAPVHVTVSDTAAPSGGAVQAMRVTAGQLFLTYTGTAGTVYILQSATNLVPAPLVMWAPLETYTAPLSGAITSSVSTATNRVRYYRTVVP
jgi:autotransporter-associated beta strand protein